MARIPGVAGAELAHPYEVDTVEVMRRELERRNLQVAANIRRTNLLWKWLDRVDREGLPRAMANHQALPAWKELESCLPKAN